MEKIEDVEFTNASQSKMRFQFGFEFQESNGLGEWAKNNSSIQKKALFNTYLKGSKKPLHKKYPVQHSVICFHMLTKGLIQILSIHTECKEVVAFKFDNV